MTKASGSTRYVLSIDQGTTGTHVSVRDSRLREVGRAYRELKQHFPKPGWVEHDLDEIWSSTESCIARALRDAGLKGRQISAVGITNQRETTGLWHRESGKPFGRAVVWQDRRTAVLCAALKAQGLEPKVRARTGLVLDPYFSGTKVQWLIDHCWHSWQGRHSGQGRRGPALRARAERGEVCFGTVDSWLVYRLTGGSAHVTDTSNASRTLLMDLHACHWSAEMLELFGVPRPMLPEIRSSSEVYGRTRGLKALPDGVPVCGIAGDQQAALFGQACFSPGDSKCTYGTGAFLLMNTGERAVESKSGLLTTVAWTLGAKTHYALEGSSFIAGAAVQWLRDGLKLIRKASDVSALAKQVSSSGGVVFVPALTGLGAPHWRPEARGLFSGIDRSTTAAHLARAVLEGIALQILELAWAMGQDSGQPLGSFRVDGGAAANDLLMQFQADILGLPVVRPRNLQTTGLGAAFLAGLAVGIWKSPDEIRDSWKSERIFKPRMAAATRDAHLGRWRRAVERA